MNSKIWFCLCLIFLMYNLKLLFDDYDLINYIIVEKNDELYDDFTNYLACIKLENIKNESKLQLNENENKIVSINQFLNYTLLSIESNYNNNNGKLLANQSFVFKDLVCYLIQKDDLEQILSAEFLRHYRIKLFIFSKGKFPFIYDYIFYKAETSNFIFLKVHKQKVFRNKYLTQPDKCSNYKQQFDNSRFKCINNCFQSKDVKISLYEYTYKHKKIDLNLIINYNLTINDKTYLTNSEINFDNNINNKINFNNNLINNRINFDLNHDKTKIRLHSTDNLFSTKSDKKFRYCLDLCKTIDDCFHESYNNVRVKKTYFFKFSKFTDKKKLTIDTTIYKGYYQFSIIDFYLQFFGLLFLFTGTCVIRIIPKSINLISKKLRLNSNLKFKFYFNRFNNLVLILSFIFTIYQSIEMLNEYSFKSNYPNRTAIFYFNFAFETRPFYMIICFPIEILIYNDNNILLNRNEDLINKLSLDQLINRTNKGFYNVIEDIQLYRGLHYYRDSNLTFGKDVLFMNATLDHYLTKYNLNQTLLNRCTKSKVNIGEYRYEAMMPINYLSVKFRTEYWYVYLFDKDQEFSSNLNRIKGEFLVGKRIYKYSLNSKKSNCFNYIDQYNSSRGQSIDQCINRLFYEKYQNLTLHSTFDLNLINLSSSLDNIYFTNKKDIEIEEKCKNRFNSKECRNYLFYETFKTSYRYNSTKLILNLNYEELIDKEMDISFVKVILNIINLISILFGTNMLGILTNSLIFIKFKFMNFFIILICLIGFSIHNFSVFHSIMNDDLIYSGHFRKMDDFYLPTSIFCFEIENYDKIDPNYLLNGNYLDKFTKDISYENVFELIWYFNKTHRNIFKTRSNGNQNSEISISTFYYLYLKCIEIELKVNFTEDDFYLLPTRNIMGVYFNNEFANKKEDVYFLFRRSKKLKQFSNSFLFRLKNDPDKKLNFTYEIYFEKFDLIKTDQFETLKNAFKNPLSLLYNDKIHLNDATFYLNNLINKFKSKFNRTTIKVILEDDKLNNNFKMEINDLLFIQYYLQVQNSSFDSDISKTTTNSQQQIYYIFPQYGYSHYNKPGMVFSISLLKRIVNISNDDNITKLIQSILNCLSLWLDICILDVIIFFKKLIIFIKLVYKFMNYIKFRLYSDLFL